MKQAAAAAIEARGLKKAFGGTPVVDGVSFTVGEGEVIGLLGPNGAGKTTTLRLLAGLYCADGGEATVAGERVRAGVLPGAALRAKVGLLTESPGFYPRLTARENLLHFAALYGGGRLRPEIRERANRELERFGLTPHADRRYGALSRGMMQKLAIIRSVLHDPPVVLLDEPTVGLDPESVGALRALVVELAEAGHAVLLCSHLLDEVERLCQRAVFLARRVVGVHAVDSPEHRVCVAFVGERAWARPPGKTGEAGAGPVDLVTVVDVLPEVREAKWIGSELSIDLLDADDVAGVVRALVQAGARIRSVRPARVALESAYLSLLETARAEGLLE